MHDNSSIFSGLFSVSVEDVDDGYLNKLWQVGQNSNCKIRILSGYQISSH